MLRLTCIASDAKLCFASLEYMERSLRFNSSILDIVSCIMVFDMKAVSMKSFRQRI